MIIHELQALANLSAAQVGRLFGVPTRSVWNWHDTVPDRYQERYDHVVNTLTALGSTPAERKARLLDSSNGMSVLHQLIDDVPLSQRIQYEVPVHQQLGLEPPDREPEEA